jgi:sec-independent protein translocase protein TatC
MVPEPEPDPFQHTRMSLGEHLEELRRRLFRGILALAIAFGVSWGFHDRIDRWMLWPLQTSVGWINSKLAQDAERHLAEHPEIPRSELFLSDDPSDRRLRKALDPRPQGIAIGEPFFFSFKNAGWFALFLGAPVLLWQMWGFIAAGLYERERRMVMRYFPASLALFAVGVLASFFVMVPVGIYFLQLSGLDFALVEFDPSLREYMSFLTTTTLAAGTVFQLPLVMQVLIRLDIVPADTFARYRRHCIVGCFLVSGIVTPSGDPASQALMAVPMWLLYEAGIVAGRMAVRRQAREAVA